MAEKIPTSVPHIHRFRWLAVLPAVLSTIAFILQLCTVISGTQNGTLLGLDLMTVNTSKVGENIVRFAPVGATAAKLRRQTNPLDPFGILPTTTPSIPAPTGLESSVTAGFGSATSALGSAASSATSAVGSVASAISVPIPTAALPTSFPTLGETGTSTAGFIGDVISFVLDAFLAPIVIAADGELNKAEAALVQKITDAIGIADWYSLHMTTVCSGNYTSASSSTKTLDHCTSYSSFGNKFKNATDVTIPSSFAILSTNVSVPALAEVNPIIDKVDSLITALGILSIVFHVVSLLGTASTAILSVVAFFMPGSFLIVRIVTFTSFLSTAFQTITAIAFTVVIAVVCSAINKYASSVGMYATSGGGFLALTWVGFVLANIGGFYWEGVWFVETRRTSFKRRLRTESEMGDYKGITREVISDVKRPVVGRSDGLEEGLVVGGYSKRPRGDPTRRRSTYSSLKNYDGRPF